MHGKTVLAFLPEKKKAKIIEINSGHQMHHRLNVMGLRKGQIVEIISKQPFMGPLTISTGKNNITIGRGMAHKIIVEEI